MLKVSVALPTYNHEPYIRACLRSVLAQTFTDFEIVLIDNASTDGTVAAARSVEDPRIRLSVNQRNLGASANINRCIASSRGEYIAMFCSDDLWDPDKLRIQVAYLDAHPDVAAVFTKADFMGEHGGPLAGVDQEPYATAFQQPNRGRHAWLSHFFHELNCLCYPSVLIRRSCHESIGMYTESLAQLPDFEMWIRICARHDIHVVDARMVRLRIRDHQANASAGTPTNLTRTESELMQVLRAYAEFPLEDFLTAFPEHICDRRVAGELPMPLHLACLCLQDSSIRHYVHVYRTLGFDLLAAALSDGSTSPIPEFRWPVPENLLVACLPDYACFSGKAGTDPGYFLARVGIACGGVPAALGIQWLLRAMSNPVAAERLARLHAFHPMDLIQLTGQVEMFPHGVPGLKALVTALRSSRSFRLGHALLWPIRALRRMAGRG